MKKISFFLIIWLVYFFVSFLDQNQSILASSKNITSDFAYPNKKEKEDLDTASSYNNIGWMYDNLGDYKKALEFYNNALKIQLKILGENHPDTAISYNNIGWVYYALGNYKKALEFLNKSLNIRLKTLGENHPDIAISYNNIGTIYSNLGNYKKALEFYNNALKIQLKTLGGNHPDTAISYNNIGIAYSNLGNYKKALEFYNNALNIRLKILGENHPDTASSYNNIGWMYDNLGDYKKALEFYNNALKIKLKTLGENHPDIAISYNNIGATYSNLSDYKKALEFYNNALKIQLKTLGGNHPDTAISYNNIGWVYYALGNYKKALEFLNKSLNIRLKILGENHPDTAISYNNIGWIYYTLGNYKKALEFLNKSLNIRLKILGENHPDTAISYNNIGWVYYNLKEYDKAFFYAKKALDIFLKEKEKVLQLLDNTQKNLYIGSKKHYITLLLEAGYRYYNQQKNHDIIIQIFNRWINYKGSILDSENILVTIYEKTSNNALKEKIKQLFIKQRQLARLYQTLPKNQNESIKWREKSKRLEKKINALRLEIASKSEKFKQHLQLSQITYKAITQNLRENELYIDYAKTKETYYIFTLDKNENFTLKKINTESVDRLIKKFRKKINALARADLAQNLSKITETTKQILSQLYILTLQKPLGNIIKSKNPLIISPDGALRLIPFEALYNSNIHHYLIESYDIKYIPTGKELVRLSKQLKQGKEIPQKVVIFADPAYNMNIKTKNTKEEKDIIPISGSIIQSNYLQHIYFPELAGTEEEANVIEKLLKPKGFKIEKYLKYETTEENLLKVKNTKILHIATHGAFIDDNSIKSPMLKALIAMAGANKSIEQGSDYGLVTALKLSGMDLSGTDLVVLSACETGLVDKNSTEGISALAKAFILAGSKNTMISLWKVNDNATKELMKLFYSALKEGSSYSQALKKSKLKIIKKDKHPYFWAPFIINGLSFSDI